VTAFAIRAAVAADAAFLPAIEQSAGELFATLPDLAWLATGENRSVDFYRASIDSGWCWIAEQDGRLCAFLAGDQTGDCLHVHELGVARPAQRRGIGTALMRTAIDAANIEGLRGVTLTTFADVAWNAPAYERIGFRRLAANEIGPDLRAIFEREAKAGLPMDRRCAMRIDLAR